jgi:hypothetical protein
MKSETVVVVAFTLCLLVPGGSLAAFQDSKKKESIKDFTGVDPVSLGVKPVPAKEDTRTRFVVGGKNSTALISTLKEINGRTIAALENDMRPGADSEVGSDSGFLGKDEALLEILATDNKVVVDGLGMTHQELAKHMHVLGALGGKVGNAEFLYHGRHFRVTLLPTRGYQLSPFHDGTKTSADVVVRNVSNGKEIRYSLLVPFMVERYGFYEGRGTPYRVDPGKLLEVFDFLGKPAKP